MQENERYPVGHLVLTKEYGYAHIKLTVAWKEKGNDTLYAYSGNPDDEITMGELVAQCQMHPMDDETGWCEPYGQSLDYRGYAVMDLPRLEKRAKFLRQLWRKLDKIAEKYGPSYSYGVHATRVAVALGLKEIYMDNNCNSFKPRDIEGLVNHLVSKLRDKK